MPCEDLMGPGMSAAYLMRTSSSSLGLADANRPNELEIDQLQKDEKKKVA